MFYSVADAVGARGVPFVFVTRYGVEGIDGRFAQVLVLQKPIERQMLQSVFLDGGHGSGKHCSDTQTVFDESMVLPNQIIRVFSRTVFKSAYRGCPQRISRAARGEARPPLPLSLTTGRSFASILAQCPKPAAVAIDTLNRSLAGSESSDEDMAAYIRAADAIRDAFNCAVVIVHHCGHEGTRPRGHLSLRALS